MFKVLGTAVAPFPELMWWALLSACVDFLFFCHRSDTGNSFLGVEIKYALKRTLMMHSNAH